MTRANVLPYNPYIDVTSIESKGTTSFAKARGATADENADWTTSIRVQWLCGSLTREAESRSPFLPSSSVRSYRASGAHVRLVHVRGTRGSYLNARKKIMHDHYLSSIILIRRFTGGLLAFIVRHAISEFNDAHSYDGALMKLPTFLLLPIVEFPHLIEFISMSPPPCRIFYLSLLFIFRKKALYPR